MDWRLLLTVWRESCWCGVAVGGEPRLRLLACWSLELLLTACYFRLILLLLFTVLLATGISRLEQEKRSCCEKRRIGSGRCLATVERLLLLTLLALNSREATGVCCCLDREEQITLVKRGSAATTAQGCCCCLLLDENRRPVLCLRLQR
jgi:hypothetical protein